MPFSLSGAVPEHAAGSGATGKLASWAATSDVQVDAQIPVDLPPPIFWVDTLRETLRDAAGKITGYRETVSGPGYSSVTVFDAGDEFVSSEYRDSSGYHSSTVRRRLETRSGRPPATARRVSGMAQDRPTGQSPTTTPRSTW